MWYKTLLLVAVLALQASPAFAQPTSLSEATITFGDHTNWRPISPFQGGLSNTYRNRGPLTQSGNISSANEVHIYCGDAVTLNASVLVTSGTNFYIETIGPVIITGACSITGGSSIDIRSMSTITVASGANITTSGTVKLEAKGGVTVAGGATVNGTAGTNVFQYLEGPRNFGWLGQ